MQQTPQAQPVGLITGGKEEAVQAAATVDDYAQIHAQSAACSLVRIPVVQLEYRSMQEAVAHKGEPCGGADTQTDVSELFFTHD